MNIYKNEIETMDGWLPLGTTYEGAFFKIGSIINRPYNNKVWPGELLRVNLYL